MKYIVDRMKEPSSWAGLGAILAVVGVNLDGQLLQAVAGLGAAIAGLLSFFIAEKGEA
jgi:ABC-type Fe3+-siderophore transport system permease subunit